MNPTGSFGAATGGISPELAAAMQSRSGGSAGGTSSQVTQGAPTFDPSTQPPIPPTASAPMPSISPSPAPAGQAPAPTGDQGTKLPFDGSETKIIINSLGGALKSLLRIHGGQ